MVVETEKAGELAAHLKLMEFHHQRAWTTFAEKTTYQDLSAKHQCKEWIDIVFFGVREDTLAIFKTTKL
jgi:hypothetical protein